jgi:hypothetical protein
LIYEPFELKITNKAIAATCQPIRPFPKRNRIGSAAFTADHFSRKGNRGFVHGNIEITRTIQIKN